LEGTFSFSLRNANPQTVSEISSNVAGVFDPESCTYTISTVVKVPAIFVTTTLRNSLVSSSVCAGRFLCATAFLPPPSGAGEPAAEIGSDVSEFVFVVDCSGSMEDRRMASARSCLELFLRSIPANSFFNVIRFGSSFETLFSESEPYGQVSIEKALNLAREMKSDLKGTDLSAPLLHLFAQPPKVPGSRQVFVLTDGEVDDTDEVIEIARRSSARNRCFTIGIGKGADAGLVEGIAEATGGRCDFVSWGIDLRKVVISQLELSFQSGITEVRVNIAGHDAIEVSPFPIAPLFPNIASTFFVRDSTPFTTGTPILLSGNQNGSETECLIESEEDGRLERCLSVLFAFTTLQRFERQVSEAGIMAPALAIRAVDLSVDSGVLCRETAFVGFSEKSYVGHFQQKGTRPVLGGRGIPHNDSDDEYNTQKPTGQSSQGDLFARIIEEQESGGWWTDPDELLGMVGSQLGDLPGLNDQSMPVELRATIIAIAILRKKCGQQQSLWKLIERKALKWLQAQASDYETVIEQVMTTLPS
jgi:hypothetical protein